MELALTNISTRNQQIIAIVWEQKVLFVRTCTMAETTQDPVSFQQYYLRNCIRNDRITLVVFMISNKVSDPSCRCYQFTSRTLLDKVQIRRETLGRDGIGIDVIEIGAN